MRQPSPHRIHWAAVLFFGAFCSPAAAQSTKNPLQLRPDHATAAVTDLDRAVRWARAFATLQSRGADVSTRGNPAPAQITTFLLHDSEGNEIEIVQEH